MTAGFFSPLPPQQTGVADYSATLLRALRRTGRVEVEPTHSDVNLYHIGNNQLHRHIYERALREPGVVVLHDAVLHHFALGFFDQRHYIDEFVYNYGEWSAGLAASLWAARARSGGDERFFRYGMLKRLAERSLSLVVHNPAAAAMVRQHCHDARVQEIPHLFEPPATPSGADIQDVRQWIGAGSRTIVAGIFGHLRESKRIMAVLRTLHRMRGSDIILVLAGNCSSRDLGRAIQPLLENSQIRRLGFLREPDFWRVAHAADVCINLRYPGAGETSGISIRMMGIGKPVAVTEGRETERFPQHSCIRVPHGLGEEQILEDTLRWLLRFPDHGREIGASARTHIRNTHSVEHVANLYWHTLKEARG